VPWVQKVYQIIAERLPGNHAADSVDPLEAELVHPLSEIEQIKTIMYDHVTDARKAGGQQLQTLAEAGQAATKRAMQVFRRKPIIDSAGKQTGVGYATDGFWNPMTGVGSLDDPGVYNYSYIPVSMSPQEATSYYASGGIPAVIIDKKAKGALLNGYSFEGDGWDPEEFKELHDYGEKVRFGAALSDGIRDGLVFGGAIAYPRLKQDTVGTLALTGGWRALVREKLLTKNSIDYFVTTDRWNCVLVPSWNVTARDYLNPNHYYIPIGGVKVASDRSAIIRPKMLPYWGMLPQIGWGASDFEGYIPAYLAYRIVIMSIPVIVQQMSLLFHEIPLDGVIAQNGLAAVEELLSHNDQAVRGWSILHPASISSFGKVSAVERSFTGFGEMVGLLQVDVCACAEMPQTVIFPAQATGLADSNTEDVLLKQAESVQKVGMAVAPQFQNLVQILAVSCFGPDYFNDTEGERKLSSLTLSFNPPSVQTAAERAESGGKFADFVQKLTSADMPTHAVIELSKQFFPDVEISDEIMDELGAIGETDKAPEYAKVLSEGGLPELLAQTRPGGEIGQVLGDGGLAGALTKLPGYIAALQTLPAELKN
jgi:hypothetical protein